MSANHKERQQERERGTKELQESQETMNKTSIVSLFISIIILRITGLNSLIKILEWLYHMLSKINSLDLRIQIG